MNQIGHERLHKLFDADAAKTLDAKALASAEGAAEAADPLQHKREAVSGLEKRLAAETGTNAELSEVVGTAAVELVADVLVVEPEAVAADGDIVAERLPAVDKTALAKIAGEAQTLTDQLTASPDDASLHTKAEKFCQEQLGASLADVLQASGELVIPSSDLTSVRKILEGDATLRDVPKAVLGIINPIGTLMIRLVEGDMTRDSVINDVRRLALKGRLCAGLASTLAYVVPEAKFVLKPASAVLGSVSKELQLVMDKPNVTALDEAKAILRGLIPASKTERTAVIKAIGKAAGDEAALTKIGLGEDGRAVAKMLAAAIEKHPDKISDVLMQAAGHEAAA